MADYKVTDTELTSIANAIRTKGGTSEQLEFPTAFIDAIDDISGITAADEGKVVSNGELVAQISGSAVANGTVDTTLINSLAVNVPQTVVMPTSLTVTPPTKTEYEQGDTLDLTGIAVVANYSDGTTSVVTGDCTFSPDDGDTLDTSGDVTITATYNGTGSVSGGSYSVQLTGTTSVHVAAVIEIVPWSTGTDAQIVAMIEAARNGDIDLQTDGGWAVGDTRSITVDTFSSGDKTQPQQTVDIVISQFGDYMNCGCVMQFDFKDALSEKVRMHSTNTNEVGWGGAEMKTSTMPALVNALPAWLSGLLIEFSVLVKAGGKSSSPAIQTITGNKLALRSATEVFGYSPSEGTQLDYYKTQANRIKKLGHSGSADYWFLRSPANNGYSYYNATTDTGTSSSVMAGDRAGVAPFGCI